MILLKNKETDQNWRDLEIIWDFLNIKHDLPAKADVGIVGGAGNLVDGAIRAAELYENGVISLIVVSGFANSYLDGEETEAELLSRKLLEQGVSQEAIIQGPYATNTAENITNAQKLLKEVGINPKKVVLIHKPYMTRRFYVTALVYWPKPQPEFFSTSAKSSLRDFYEYDKNVYGGEGRMITLMIGDYERIKEYPKRGWMAKQTIPKEVEDAYIRLTNDGLAEKEIKA
jgi:uncharacterized SAM-binding protein YcdF (DUF218 family)